MRSKSELAVFLSKLKIFDEPKAGLEQYPTDSEVAASVLWSAMMNGDIESKIIADLGCGTGILAIGALLLGAKKVYCVDIDLAALNICRQNVSLLAGAEKRLEIVHSPVSEFNKDVDCVIQNPPFGVQNRHSDRIFLLKAFEIAPVVYSLHKLESEHFLQKFSDGAGFRITNLIKFSFPLKQTQSFHKKRIHRVDVGCWRFEKR